MFDLSMVNEPSGFEPLKFYCMYRYEIERILVELKHCIILAALCLTVNRNTFQSFHYNF